MTLNGSHEIAVVPYDLLRWSVPWIAPADNIEAVTDPGSDQRCEVVWMIEIHGVDAEQPQTFEVVSCRVIREGDHGVN